MNQMTIACVTWPIAASSKARLYDLGPIKIKPTFDGFSIELVSMFSLVLDKSNETANSNHENPPNTKLNRFNKLMTLWKIIRKVKKNQKNILQFLFYKLPLLMVFLGFIILRNCEFSTWTLTCFIQQERSFSSWIFPSCKGNSISLNLFFFVKIKSFNESKF